MFGCIFPGRPPAAASAFRQLDATRWCLDVDGASEIKEVVVFLSEPIAVPGHGLAVYVTAPPFTDWRFLGHISNETPSAVFRIRWSINEAVPSAVQLGLTIEPLDAILMKTQLLPPHEFVESGKKVAKDLWRFMASFSQSIGATTEYMQVPTNILDRWMARFDQKCKVDPYFWLKES